MVFACFTAPTAADNCINSGFVFPCMYVVSRNHAHSKHCIKSFFLHLEDTGMPASWHLVVNVSVDNNNNSWRSFTNNSALFSSYEMSSTCGGVSSVILERVSSSVSNAAHTCFSSVVVVVVLWEPFLLVFVFVFVVVVVVSSMPVL